MTTRAGESGGSCGNCATCKCAGLDKAAEGESSLADLLAALLEDAKADGSSAVVEAGHGEV